jgi:type II secretory pathway pseudopilin PulG
MQKRYNQSDPPDRTDRTDPPVQSDTESAGFTLLETLAALALSALMIGAILGAQGLTLRAESRARSTPLLRCAAGQLLSARMLGGRVNEDAPPAGIVWRMTAVATSKTNQWQQWDVRSAHSDSVVQTLFFRSVPSEQSDKFF